MRGVCANGPQKTSMDDIIPKTLVSSSVFYSVLVRLECARTVVECSKLLCSDVVRYCAKYVSRLQVWHRQTGLSPMTVVTLLLAPVSGS
jgi:hypothetical protein